MNLVREMTEDFYMYHQQKEVEGKSESIPEWSRRFKDKEYGKDLNGEQTVPSGSLQVL